MHTGQPKPHSMITEDITKRILDTATQYYVFPALKESNNVATIDYDADINTKTDYTKKMYVVP